MTTYVYETIPENPGQKPIYHEIKQSMKDAPLTQHPDTGVPIRRVVLGGFGVLKSSAKSQPAAPNGGCGCSPGGCCN
jgi:predicted nucleic acid-binding Zn ribbon protein